MNMIKQLRRRQAKDTAREEATRLVLDRWADFIDELLAKADRLRMPECDYEERQRLLNEYRCPTEKGGFGC